MKNESPLNFDIAVRCGVLLTMKEGDEAPKKNMLVGIRGSKIEYVGAESGAPAWQAAKVIDASNKIVMPGLVNGHMHLPMSLFRGLADDLPFQQWLHEYILPLEGRLVSPEFVRVGAELAILECIQRGVTTVCDMYYFEDEIADVVDKAGLRGVMGETIADFPAPDCRENAAGNYAILDRMRERYGNHERIVPCIAPHAPYTCSDATLKKAADYAIKHGLPLSIHVSETKFELDTSMKEHRMTPVERMNKCGIMDGPAALFAHGVHVTESDRKLLAKKKTAIIHNPESNMKLGSGAAPVRELLDAGVTVGIGTDGAASNNDLNLWNELDTAAKLQKLTHASNTAMTAVEALRLATRQGAQALGLGKKTGTLETGKLADLIVVDTDSVNMQPMHDPASQLVYATTGTEVETVICHGKIVMEEWNVLTMNRRDVLTRVARYRERNNF